MKNIAKEIIQEIADEMPVLVQIQPMSAQAKADASFRRLENELLAVAYRAVENLCPVR